MYKYNIISINFFLKKDLYKYIEMENLWKINLYIR